MKENKFALVLLLHFKLQKVMATVCGKCLVKIKKSLNLWVEDMNKNRVPFDANVSQPKE